MEQARGHVRDELGAALDPSRVSEVELMTSELVSNAVRFADADGAPIGLDIHLSAERVLVGVADRGAGFIVPDDRRTLRAGGGWGLAIVDHISDRWGVRTTRPHTVWFEIDRT